MGRRPSKAVLNMSLISVPSTVPIGLRTLWCSVLSPERLDSSAFIIVVAARDGRILD